MVLTQLCVTQVHVYNQCASQLSKDPSSAHFGLLAAYLLSQFKNFYFAYGSNTQEAIVSKSTAEQRQQMRKTTL